MNTKILAGVAGLLLTSLLLPACGGSDGPKAAAAAPAPAPAQLNAETPAGVLALARVPSDTDDPQIVTGTSIAAADLNDETSDPIPVS